MSEDANKEIRMARYPLNLPVDLKKEAEAWADKQKISLNQFIMWAVAEKVGALKQNLDDPAFPKITYRRGAAGIPTPVIRGTIIRVQTIVLARDAWSMTVEQIASEYDLSKHDVRQALAFYQAHREEIDRAISAEGELETEHA
jgi:uncharacterized protein (DUF433 family)